MHGNTTKKIFFSELLIMISRDRDNGLDIDLDCLLDQIVDVFKQDDAPEDRQGGAPLHIAQTPRPPSALNILS